jgi:hypothetical protein
MTFTYSLTTDLGKVRFELDDTVLNKGVRPDGSNLSDEEITMLLTREGSVMGAVAAACDMLSRSWSKVASTSLGPASEQLGKVAQEWADRATGIRENVGSENTSFSFAPNRVDGYSEHADGYE